MSQSEVVDPASPTAASPAPPAGSVDLPPPPASETALQIWQAFDLNGRRAILDKQGLDIADGQERSAAARKSLAASTRAFKQFAKDNAQINSKEFAPLMRSYQAEIDALTTRAKGAESSFLTLYKALYDAPDPVEGLELGAKHGATVAELREELRILKKERGDMVERTVAAAGNENRIEELEKQLAGMGEKVEEEARAKIEDKQAQWMAAQQKTIEAYEMREQELLHQIRLGNENGRRMQANADELQRRLNDAHSQMENVKSTRASVSEMAVEDLERTRAEVKSLRRRCIEFENQIGLDGGEGVSVDGLVSGSSAGRSALSAELAARDVEVSQLKDQVAALEEVLGGKNQEQRKEFESLTSSIVAKDAELGKLRQDLERLPSLEEYETMKRQYETLQSFQLLENDRDAGDTRDGSSGGADNASTTKGETLEKRLLGKVKSLEGKLTRMRVDLAERDSRINELLAMVRGFEERIVDQRELISKLEEGINAMTGDQAGVQSLKRRAVVASRSEPDASATVDDEEGENGPGDSTWDWGEKHQAEGLQNIIREEPSMLDIVAGQRDRFRARSMELEEDNRKLMERIGKLTSDIDSLKNDNVRLYEKIRFVQSYKQSSSSLTLETGGSRADASQSAGDEEDGGSFLGKYKSMYEDMVNPYTIFNRRERHKRMSEMSAPERLTLRAGQKALSTKASRLVVFFYIIALHIFVALVLGFSSNFGCETDVTTKAQH